MGHDYELLGDGFKTNKRKQFKRKVQANWKSLAQDNTGLKKYKVYKAIL